MKAAIVVLVLCSIIAVCARAPVFEEDRVYLESKTAYPVPAGWKRGDRAFNESVTLMFAIKQQNLKELENTFWAVSDPASPRYGKFLSAEETAALIAPKDSDVELVLEWLRSNGIIKHHFVNAREWLEVTVPARVAGRILGISYYHFEAIGNPKISFIRSTDAYSVPKKVAPALDFVAGTHRLPLLKKMKVSRTPSPLAGSVNPNVIKKVFDITVEGSYAKNSQAVNQFLKQYYSPSDLQSFFSDFDLPKETVLKEEGPNNPNEPGLEANLDIQYIMGVATNVPTWFISTGGDVGGQEPFLKWVTNLLSQKDIPYVFTISYGDTEASRSKEYTYRCNTEFQKIALIGRTLIFASGDDGVNCENGKNGPNWPATSPYVTAIGGVVLIQEDPVEIYSDAISSGGFSDYFPRASYQEKTIKEYFATATNLPPEAQYNKSGRAFPDLASFSENVIVVYEGGEMYVGGTSCAAPVFGGMVSLLNGLRLKAGKSVLGFLNPALYDIAYTTPSAFYDVTKGPSNANGNCQGFLPKKGWDPITGFGAPNFEGMRKALV